MANWVNLPSDLLELIAERLLPQIADYARFRAVCRSWRSAAADPRRPGFSPQLPWLLLDRVGDSNDILSYFSLSDRRVHSIRLLDADAGAGEHLLLSSGGWLVFSDPPSLTLSLANPLTGACVRLPPLSQLLLGVARGLRDPIMPPRRFQDQPPVGYRRRLFYYPEKYQWVKALAFSASPTSPGGCTILVSLAGGRGLVALRAGRRDWAFVDRNRGSSYNSIVFHKGQGRFYAVEASRAVVAFNADDLHKVALIELTVPVDSCRWRLVESPGEEDPELLLVHGNFRRRRRVDGDEHDPPPEIYRLDLTSGKPSRLVRVASLGERMLFLGTRNSISVPAKGFHSCRHNCVYVSPGVAHGLAKTSWGYWTSAWSAAGFKAFKVVDGCVVELPDYMDGQIKLCGDGTIITWHMLSPC